MGPMGYDPEDFLRLDHEEIWRSCCLNRMPHVGNAFPFPDSTGRAKCLDSQNNSAFSCYFP